MFDPWQVFAALPGWQLLWQPVPTRAQICWSRRTILLDPRLPVPAQRVALTHELVHVARGPYLLRVRRREEAAVRRETALLLVDIVHLADAPPHGPAARS
ncbi:MAG: hypothetical protein IPJ61_13050 [Tessaracoccus sp.]|uniref:hypothetical protein n=1 Tax=Tessaracoccus sp. TaxID=1971211 RepID=UPI001EC94F94|nr:hypothetical protein [Tessaracoccus sp.]MBK7821965.1 hypothetical protein [Tessaracoccus sp.]